MNFFAGWSKRCDARHAPLARNDSRKFVGSEPARWIPARVAFAHPCAACDYLAPTPVSIGRDGSRIHSLHEPAYSLRQFARNLHREQQIAGGDAGAAHDDCVFVGDAGLRFSKFTRSSGAARIVRGCRDWARTDDCARRAHDLRSDRRARLAGKTFWRARVEQSPLVAADTIGDLLVPATSRFGVPTSSSCARRNRRSRRVVRRQSRP